MKEYILVIILFIIIIFLLRSRQSDYTELTPNDDRYVVFFQMGTDINPAVTNAIVSADERLSITDLNKNMWSDPSKASYWGLRKVMQDGGGGAVSYLTFADDAAATAALTEPTYVLTTYNHLGQDYLIPTVVIVKKSIANPTETCILGKTLSVNGSCHKPISVKNAHGCIVLQDGNIYSWGTNQYGQLGIGTTTQVFTWVPVPNFTNAVQVVCGSQHTCALKTDGTVYCWGNNGSGQLGDGTVTQRNSPVQVPGLTEIISVACGAYHTCALKKNGTVYCWGNNGNGQLGDGTVIQRNSPTLVPGLTTVVSITGGWLHTAAIVSDRTMYCWGSNMFGELGDGTSTESHTPKLVYGFSDVADIACGTYMTVALKTDGTVYCWGYNSNGQLGDGTQINRSTPTQSVGLTGVAQIACSTYHVGAITTDGSLYFWGWCPNGSAVSDILLIPTLANIPGLIGEKFMNISCGTNLSVATLLNGAAYYWGQLMPTTMIGSIKFPGCTNATIGQYYVGRPCLVTNCPPAANGKYFKTAGYCDVGQCTNAVPVLTYTGPGTTSTNCPVGGCRAVCPSNAYDGASQTRFYTYNNNPGSGSYGVGTCQVLIRMGNQNPTGTVIGSPAPVPAQCG